MAAKGFSPTLTNGDITVPAAPGDYAERVNDEVTALWGSMPRKGNVLTPHEGLIVKYVTAATVDIDADAVVLFNSTGLGKRFATLNETPNIAASGANGLDTGAEGSSRWYHIWAIGKEDGTLDGLLSESATAPTLPSGYTFKGYLGAVYNDGSSNFVAFFQRGAFANCTDTVVLTDGTATSFTTISLSAAVPPTAASSLITGGIGVSSGTAACSLTVAAAGSGTAGTYGSTFFLRQPLGSTTKLNAGAGMIELSVAQQIGYFNTGANAQANVVVLGWRF